MVDIPRARLADGLSRELNGRRHRRMRGYARQPTQLVRPEAQDVVEPGIGAVELQRGIQLALVA
jgi:hypothetical protein